MYANTKNWIATGLVGLPLSGALTFWSSLNPQPDPGTQFEAWARFVTTDHYVLGHLIGSGLGLIAGVFGTVALGAYLTAGRSPRLGLASMTVAILGAMLFLMPMGVSTFSAPADGLAFLASGQRAADLPPSLSAQLFGLTLLLVIVLNLVGNVLLGVAIWRSELLPKWTGLLWAAAPLLMYVFGVVYALVIGVQSTPPTVPLGAALMVLSGAAIVWHHQGHAVSFAWSIVSPVRTIEGRPSTGDAMLVLASLHASVVTSEHAADHRSLSCGIVDATSLLHGHTPSPTED